MGIAIFDETADSIYTDDVSLLLKKFCTVSENENIPVHRRDPGISSGCDRSTKVSRRLYKDLEGVQEAFILHDTRRQGRPPLPVVEEASKVKFVQVPIREGH